MTTKEHYTAAAAKALELNGLIYPERGDRLGFTFPTEAAKTEFWLWFSGLGNKDCISSGWVSPLNGNNEVVLSFTDHSFKT